MMEPLYIISAVIVALVTFVFTQSVMIVKQGEKVVLERWGSFSSVRSAGIHFLMPFIDRPHTVEWTRRVEVRKANQKSASVVDEKFVGYRIRTSNIVFDIPPVVCYSKEKVQIDVNIVVYYNITDLQKAVYQVGDLYSSIQYKVETLLINMIQRVSIEEITNQEIEKQMTILANQEKWQEEWGVRLGRFDIQQVVFPSQLSNATIDTVTLRRKLEAEELSLNSERTKELKRLENLEDIAESKRRSELNRKAFELKQAKLEHEYQQQRKMTEAETEINVGKSQLELETERQRMKYQIKKEAGLGEKYFIERERRKSIGSILEAGINGKGNTLIIPLEALSNGFTMNRLLPGNPTPETIVVNK